VARTKKRHYGRIKLILVVFGLLTLALATYLVLNPKPESESSAAYLPDDGLAIGTPRIRIGGRAYDCQNRPMKNVYVAAIWNDGVRDEDTTDANGLFHISSNINFDSFALVAGRDVRGDVQQLFMKRVKSPNFVGVSGQKVGCDKVNCRFREWKVNNRQIINEHYHVGVHNVWTESYFNDFFVSKSNPSSGFDFQIANCPSSGIKLDIRKSGKGQLLKWTHSGRRNSNTAVKFYYIPYPNKPIIDLTCADTKNKWKEIIQTNKRNYGPNTLYWEPGPGTNYPGKGTYLVAANITSNNNLCTGSPAYNPSTGKSCVNSGDYCNYSGNREDDTMWKKLVI